MIVRCPECETGYSLSPEKVPAKGAKLRCSKCNHVFRVRINASGHPEIFYKNKQPNNNATMLGGPMVGTHHVRETAPMPAAKNGQTSFGRPMRSGTEPRLRQNIPKQPSAPPPAVKAMQLRAPILTPPAFSMDSPPKASTPRTAQPPPHPIEIATPARKLTPPPSAEIDLFGDESGFGSEIPSMDDDPFSGAFDDEKKDDFFPPTGPLSEDDFLSSSPSEEIAAVQKDIGNTIMQWEQQDPPLPSRLEENADNFFARGGSLTNFDDLRPKESSKNPEHRVDVSDPEPTLQVDLKSQDPNPSPSFPEEREEKIELAFERPPKKKTRPTQRERKKQKAKNRSVKSSTTKSTASKKSKKSRSGAQKPAQSTARAAPHKIGGGTARRLADTFFITLIVLCGFVGFIAFKTGGFFDFSQPLHMLEVAFEERPYQPTTQIKSFLDQSSNPPEATVLEKAPQKSIATSKSLEKLPKKKLKKTKESPKTK